MTNSNVAERQSWYQNPWMIVAMLCVVGCLNYLDRMVIATMRGSIMETIPMSEAQFGLLTSVFLWTYGLVSPLMGFLADRFNKSKIIILSLFVWSVVTWLTGHATTFNELLATRVLMGISEACYIPAALGLIVEYHRGNTRSLATGIHVAGIIAGQSLGFTGGWLAEKYDWTFAFTVFGFIGVVQAVLLLFFLRDKKKPIIANPEIGIKPVKEKVQLTAALKTLLTNKNFLLLLSFYSLVAIVAWMTIGWLATFMKERFDLSQTDAGIYSTAYIYPLAFVGAILGGWLADRYSKKYHRARILVPVFGLLAATPFVFIAGISTWLPLTIFSFMVFSCTRVFADANIMPIICQIVESKYTSTAMGVVNACACIVGGLGLFASGALRDSQVNLGTMFQIASIFMILAILLLNKINPPKQNLSQS